ncbi:multidrug ABC transporter ATP-binding protein [Polaribacter reichenbachii]|uniref:Multidrug ABC transporter ATP-binding protein n=1 Tax=Polaribacter reichenbachii TaxID=996801 RepID=A0A1B8U1E3_9FLAO|nr:ABC transporter ATP-binding protein [Polaribacter reichenbachii]APZ47341.1 multidrug ABC transporter ATP-binding protein [Polaribacter reichenbachii]AUC17982.1 multidrug ABC transporter ATP-binding protein [Polaribacter reichenbachii]OBY65691.1 multidrug ABC transporter ATP-binding protein [Polaribacter reichenbachii]
MELIIDNLSKTYANGVKALQNISLEIPTGMFGLLGPNGAGKSTLMRTIATLQEADTGTIALGDINVLKQKNELRQVLGYLPQQFGLYPKISAEVLLNHFAVLKGITNKGERKELVESLLHKTNLYQVRKQNLKGFSGGMKQRFGIAQALLNNPKLLIVDEPTAGLDPVERNRFYNVLSELGEHTIVILSTHIVDDVKELCTNMAIINQGQVSLKGNPLQILEELKGKVYKKTINKQELNEYKQNYKVISDKLFLGKPTIHILSDVNPGDGFIQIDAALEDVYFSQIFNNTNLKTNK